MLWLAKWCQIPVGTCNTLAWVHSITWVYKLRYCTHTHKTHDLKPVGFLVPVTYPNHTMPKRQLGKIADLEQYSACNTHVHTAPIHDVIHMRDLPEYAKPQCKHVWVHWESYLYVYRHTFTLPSPYYSHFLPVTSSISSLLFVYLVALCSFVTELSLFHVCKEIKLVPYMCQEVCVFVWLCKNDKNRGLYTV